MSSSTLAPHMNGDVNSNSGPQLQMDELNKQLALAVSLPSFHGDTLIGDKQPRQGRFANLFNTIEDCRRIFTLENAPALGVLLRKALSGQGLDKESFARIVGSMSNDSNIRALILEDGMKTKYERMLHPPLTYLGNAFRYRTVDGKFNSVLHPHLGQAGAPYAKSVQSKTPPLGALPDPSDLFERLMARKDEARVSHSGLSSMLIYHATIVIHDIFRTNENDKNISDTSSYLDLSPLYGFTEEMQRKVRDDRYKLGLLKPDTFAEDRLLRQPPGVCIMLVMYSRYHNYAATQLRRINENNRFSVPHKYELPRLAAAARNFVTDSDDSFLRLLRDYENAWEEHDADRAGGNDAYETLEGDLQSRLDKTIVSDDDKARLKRFYQDYDAAWDKLDDDLFNTARLITSGLYSQIAVHDYLRGLMGFHQFDTNFTLDPRIKSRRVPRGLGNQVTVEFNLLYRFHCAISKKDEKYTEDFLRQTFGKAQDPSWDPKSISLQSFMGMMAGAAQAKKGQTKTEPWESDFGLSHQPELCFKRDAVTGLFDDQQMVDELNRAMDDPISNFGPQNVPRCMKPIEILGILQARKWEVGTLNDFREFFGLPRHETFESITANQEVQNALRDLYEHPDKVELYPGAFCECNASMNGDPGPTNAGSALWEAIFCDAITLVRSDRFYTVDWNIQSLTTWGMKEVTSESDSLKGSVYHRLLQRAFPEWFPYDSIRFFHPFYTSAKNAEFAQKQGYAEDFKMDVWGHTVDLLGRPTKYEYQTKKSNPKRPIEPIYLTKSLDIQALLADDSDTLVHPLRLELRHLPLEIAEVLKPGQKARSTLQKGDKFEGSDVLTTDYLINLIRDVVKQENVTIDPARPVYQIDVVRDFAVPVVARYVSDFLGFGDAVKTSTNPNGKYSENEIYQHITNCQVFLSHNADETKLLKRRRAFRSSMRFLFDLTRHGHFRKATSWRDYFWPPSEKKNPMSEYGFRLAQQVLGQESDAGNAAAILLLIGLDSAYHAVLAFTSVLDSFMCELDDVAAKPDQSRTCDWLAIQNLAFDDTEKAARAISDLVVRAQQKSLQLPVIRKATSECVIRDDKGRVLFVVEEGQTVICDIDDSTPEETADDLAHSSCFTDQFASYHPKHLTTLSLMAMIKVLAQMKNLRRGHGAQGRPKKIDIRASYQSYANYMAPMRIKEIERDIERGLEKARAENDVKAEAKLSKLIANNRAPVTTTYMTPEWDEMVPFPTTWKLRFDGFGPSDYGGKTFPLLQTTKLPDYAPPFYQPNGASHTGGTFGDSTDVLPAGQHGPTTKLTAGCGIPEPDMNGHAR